MLQKKKKENKSETNLPYLAMMPEFLNFIKYIFQSSDPGPGSAASNYEEYGTSLELH